MSTLAIARKRDERSFGMPACFLGGEPSDGALGYEQRPSLNLAGAPSS